VKRMSLIQPPRELSTNENLPLREARSSARDWTSARYGLIEGENVVEISGPPWGAWSRGSRSSRLTEVRLLAPVEPSKIVCIGRITQLTPRSWATMSRKSR